MAASSQTPPRPKRQCFPADVDVMQLRDHLASATSLTRGLLSHPHLDCTLCNFRRSLLSLSRHRHRESSHASRSKDSGDFNQPFRRIPTWPTSSPAVKEKPSRSGLTSAVDRQLNPFTLSKRSTSSTARACTAEHREEAGHIRWHGFFPGACGLWSQLHRHAHKKYCLYRRLVHISGSNRHDDCLDNNTGLDLLRFYNSMQGPTREDYLLTIEFRIKAQNCIGTMACIENAQTRRSLPVTGNS